MSQGFSCTATVVTDPVSGALECQNAGVPVAWTVTPSFDPSQLDPAYLTAYFTTGYAVVALGWAAGKAVSIAVRFLKEM